MQILTWLSAPKHDNSTQKETEAAFAEKVVEAGYHQSYIIIKIKITVYMVITTIEKKDKVISHTGDAEGNNRSKDTSAAPCTKEDWLKRGLCRVSLR